MRAALAEWMEAQAGQQTDEDRKRHCLSQRSEVRGQGVKGQGSEGEQEANVGELQISGALTSVFTQVLNQAGAVGML